MNEAVNEDQIVMVWPLLTVLDLDPPEKIIMIWPLLTVPDLDPPLKIMVWSPIIAPDLDPSQEKIGQDHRPETPHWTNLGIEQEHRHLTKGCTIETPPIHLSKLNPLILEV